MIKIYYKNRFITVTREKIESNDLNFKSIEFNQSKVSKISIKEFLDNKNLKHLNFYGVAPERGLAMLKIYFKPILAAGGIVCNQKSEKLFIYRNSKWDLPKGKAEKGETAELCALREVSEECGLNIKQLSIKKEIGSTYHIYTEKGKDILKTTTWFAMEYIGDDNLVKPQLEENIEKCLWVNDKDIARYLEDSYASIRQFIQVNYPEIKQVCSD